MYINSQFFVSYYPGAQPLDLMSIPASISGNAEATLIYDRFMQNVTTIYASQNSSGVIPVFWTKREDKDSGFGAGQVSFTPSENSTLTKLQPKSGYYFILRDESALPLQIPVVSGEVPVVLETSETFNVSSIEYDHTTFDGPEFIPGSLSVQPSHSQILPFKINNLENGQIYKYEFKHVDNNWPVTMSPLSGTFKPQSSSSTIQSLLTFCPSTGCCQDGTDGLLNYPDSIDNLSDFKQNNSLYQLYRLEVSPVSFEGESTVSEDIKAVCNDCLPKTRIFNLSDADNSPFSEHTLSTEGDSMYNWNVLIDNLVAGKTYTYQVDVLDANWPVIFNTPTSGTFTAKNTGFIKPMSINFCPTPSFCPVDNISVFDYAQAAKFVEKYYIRLNFSVSADRCSDTETYTSFSTSIYCHNCL